MNVLLLYPEFPDSFWSFRHALKFVGCKAALPPLGLLTVAAMLPPEWNLRLIDLNVKVLRDEDLEWADCALISAMIVQREFAKKLIARCLRVRPDLPIVAGGPLFTEESESFPEVTHLILGEAEEIFPQFVKDFMSGKAVHLYEASGYADMKNTPIPRYDLLDMKNYASMSVQFSRGCPFKCEFCDVTILFGHKPRVKSAEKVISELDALWSTGWRGSIFFVDDNFIGNKLNLKSKLLPELIKWQHSRGVGVSFYTETSINLADDEELMRLMVSAGFDTVFIGIETPDADSLAECGKTQNTKRNLLNSVRAIQHAGMEVQAGFIVGFDNDGPEIFKRQLDFISEAGIVAAMVGILQAFPGTVLYARLEKEDRVRGATPGGNAGTTNIVTKMDPEILAAGYKRLVRHIYAPQNYYGRIRTFLRQYRPAQNVKASYGPRGFMVLVRILLYIGILGKERFSFWGLMFWILFRSPRSFKIGITHAVFGHHFRIVTKGVA